MNGRTEKRYVLFPIVHGTVRPVDLPFVCIPDQVRQLWKSYKLSMTMFWTVETFLPSVLTDVCHTDALSRIFIGFLHITATTCASRPIQRLGSMCPVPEVVCFVGYWTVWCVPHCLSHDAILQAYIARVYMPRCCRSFAICFASLLLSCQVRSSNTIFPTPYRMPVLRPS